MAIRRRKEIEAGVADHFLVEGTDRRRLRGPRDRDRRTRPGRGCADRARAVRDLHPGVAPGQRTCRRPAQAAIGVAPASLWVYRDNPGPVRSTSTTTSSRTATSGSTPRASWRSGWFAGAIASLSPAALSPVLTGRPLACWSGEPRNRQNPRPALSGWRVCLAPRHGRRRGAAGDQDRRNVDLDHHADPRSRHRAGARPAAWRGHHRRPAGRHRRPVCSGWTPPGRTPTTCWTSR